MGGGRAGGGFDYSAGYRQSAVIDQKDQNKHIAGTAEYNKAIAKGEHPSVLTGNAQALLREGAGKGHMRENKEVVDYGRNIGRFYNKDTGRYNNTTRATIHYDQKGNAHIVPAKPKTLLRKRG